MSWNLVFQSYLNNFLENFVIFLWIRTYTFELILVILYVITYIRADGNDIVEGVESILAVATSWSMFKVIIADNNAQARVSLAVGLRKLDRLRRLSLRNTRSALTQCNSSLGRASF